MFIIALTISFQKKYYLRSYSASDEFLYETIRDVKEERNCHLDFNFVTLMIKSSINDTAWKRSFAKININFTESTGILLIIDAKTTNCICSEAAVLISFAYR